MALPILAGLFTPDQRSKPARRLFAVLGAVAAGLALTVAADPLGLLLLSLAATVFTGAALFATDRPGLRRFLVINGVAMLLLAWAATEHAELIIERSPEQLDVSIDGVRLSASLAGIDSPLNRVTVELGPLAERPVAAPWTATTLPWFEGLTDWLVGGMRGGVATLRVTDSTTADLVPSISGLWHPSHAGEPPPLSGGAPAWEARRAPSNAVALTSPEIVTATYRVAASLARPSGSVIVTLTGDEGDQHTPALDVIVAPDRRHFEVAVRQPSGYVDTLVGGPFVYRRSVVEWVQAILREVGRSWLVALGLVATARLLSLPTALHLPAAGGRHGGALTLVAAVPLGAIAFILTALIAWFVLGGIPHTVESIAYLFQAQVLIGGSLWAPAPILPEFFQQAYVAATADGRWFGVLPPGQSLLLVGGLLIGAPWLVGPLATALAVVVTVVVGRLTVGTAAGVLAAMLLVCSPFALLLSGDMLAHPAGLLLTMLLLLGVVMAAGRRGTLPAFGWLLAGLAMGGLVLTRPLAALGVGVPLLLCLVFGARRAGLRALTLRAVLFVIAAAPGVLYAGYVNAALTGNAMVPPLSLWSDVDRIGFGATIGTRGGHDLAAALGNTWANVAVLLRHLFGWPSYLTLALACVPYVLGARSRWDRLLLLPLGGLVAAHWVYWSDGIVYGPRFLFEAVGVLALLTARGVALLACGDGSDAADAGQPTDESPQARSAFHPPTAASHMTSAPFAVTLVALLVAFNFVGYLPEVLLAYRDYNGVSRQYLAMVEEARVQQAVVFVDSDWPNWQAYGSVFPANGPYLDRPVIYARDLGDGENWRLLTRYAERRGLVVRDGVLSEFRP